MEYDLVFEGGGAKGLVLVGAIRAFERRGHTIRRLIGTSAGSIMATLLAAGYSAKECQEAIGEKLPDGRARFTSFMDIPDIYKDENIQRELGYWLKTELDNPLIPNLIEPVVDHLVDSMLKKEGFQHLISLLFRGGWYSGDTFLAWIREKLDAGGRQLGNTTLETFNQKTGRDLSVAASDITGREMLVLNHRTAPNCPTAWAVRMSMSVPFAWQEVIWDANWGKYRGRDLTGHKVVDGGLLSNFPIDLLVSSDENICEIMGEDNIAENVLGLLIDEALPVPGTKTHLETQAAVPNLLERIDFIAEMLWRVRGMADTVLSAHDKFKMDGYQHLICRLPAKGYGTLEFDMDPERMDAIVNAGEAAMDLYFDEKLMSIEESIGMNASQISAQ